MSQSKEAVVMFTGKPGKGLTFEEFDNKVLSWARKQYGHAYAKQLWEDTLVDLNSLDLADDLDYYVFIDVIGGVIAAFVTGIVFRSDICS